MGAYISDLKMILNNDNYFGKRICRNAK